MRPHSRTRPRGSGGSHWTSYADMMAGLMLVFTLVMVFSIYQYVELQRTKDVELTAKDVELTAKESLLNDQEDQLSSQQSQIAEKEDALTAAQDQLTTQQSTLDEQAAALALKQTELDKSNQELQAAQALIDAANINLQAQRQQLSEQSTALTAAQTQMQEQQQRIDALVGVRTKIIQDLAQELRGANLNVTVDAQTGAITFKGAVLFDVNEAVLKDGGKQLLNSFLPVYVHTLLSSDYRDYVAEIIIEGHTDTDGPFLDNLRLSQDRAYAVAQYCLRDGFGGLAPEEREMLRVIMTANGRSWSNPILTESGTVNKDASRRVEFKFRLKESEMISEMSAIMEGVELALPTPSPVQ